MKGIILYHSKYGACEEIAQLLKKSLDAECMPIVKFNDSLNNYDYVVIGFSVYAGLLSKPCKQFIETHEEQLMAKPLYLFHSGINEEKETIDKLYNENIDLKVMEHVSYYDCLGGRLNFPKMNFMEKSLIKMINKKAKIVDVKQMKDNVDLIDYERIQKFVFEIKER